MRRIHLTGLIALVVLAASSTLAWAEDALPLYAQPVLVVDPDMHTAPIRRVDTDEDGHFAVTGSDDKTVRVWSLGPEPQLLTTIRIPSGPGNIGKIYAVAMSPDGELIAAGGWTRLADTDQREQIYLFSRDGGVIKRIEGSATVHDLSFSPDSRYLAAGLGVGGIRVYDRDDGCTSTRPCWPHGLGIKRKGEHGARLGCLHVLRTRGDHRRRLLSNAL